MNSCYASIEMIFHPELKDRPIAVAGNRENRHGIVLAKNELAKRCGVVTAEPIWQAQAKCPGLVLLPPHHDLYVEYSRRANAIYERYTDLVEPASIDESYLDVTGSRLLGTGREIAEQIRQSVREELQLTVSIGVSFCKFFAKMGSDYRKPDAVTEITRQNYQELLYPLPVQQLLYVGAATAENLRSVGIYTIGDLAGTDRRFLASRLGKHGASLYDFVHGLDEEPVLRPEQQEAAKSIGKGITYKRDLVSWEDIKTALQPLSASVGHRLRKAGLLCGGIQVSIKDPQLKTIDRQMQFCTPTSVTQDLYEAACDILRRQWEKGQPIRMLTVTAIHLTDPSQPQQTSLFAEDGHHERYQNLDASMDQIRQKFGDRAVRPASLLGNDLGIDE